MKTWLIAGAVVGLAGVGVYLTTAHRPRPTEAVPPVSAPLAAEPTPPAPVVLAQVVDVTDIDALLDPPAIPASDPPAAGPMVTAVGFDDPPAPPVPPPAAAVVPIPAATD
jgi:hypothetical protein